MISITIDKSKDIRALKESILAATGLACSFKLPGGSSVPENESVEKASGKSYIPAEVMLFDSARLGEIARKLEDALGFGIVLLNEDGAPVPENMTIADYSKLVKQKTDSPNITNTIGGTEETKLSDSTVDFNELKSKIESAWSSRELAALAETAAAAGNALIAVAAYKKAFEKIYIFSEYPVLLDSILANAKDLAFAADMITEIEKKAFMSSEKEIAAAYKRKFNPDIFKEIEPNREEVPAIQTGQEITMTITPDEEEKSVDSQIAEMFEVNEPGAESVVAPVDTPPAFKEHKTAGYQIASSESIDTIATEYHEIEPAETEISELFSEEVLPDTKQQETANDYSSKTFVELRHIAAAIYEFDEDRAKAKSVFLEAEKKASGAKDYFVLAKTIAGSTADHDSIREILKKAIVSSKDPDELLGIAAWVIQEYNDRNWAGNICGQAEKFSFDPTANKRIADFILKNL